MRYLVGGHRQADAAPPRQLTPFSNPVLIGALTVLVMVVGVVLAFQANNGLPFVPRYTLHIEVRNAEELMPRRRGAHGRRPDRLGVERHRHPRQGGQPIAVIDAQLNKSVEPLPVDTHFTIRMKGAIGEKFLDVTLGHAQANLAATAPPCRSARPARLVDLDQVLDMYTPPTQVGVPDDHPRLRPGAGRPRQRPQSGDRRVRPAGQRTSRR